MVGLFPCVLWYTLECWRLGGISQQQRKETVPKYLEDVLIWEEAELRYQLQSPGQTEQWYSRCGDEGAFSCWLDEHTAFAFVGQHGRISVLKEARRGNRAY